jgi:hypothetical protein
MCDIILKYTYETEIKLLWPSQILKPIKKDEKLIFTLILIIKTAPSNMNSITLENVISFSDNTQ